jgi:hypothetical protein
VRPDAEHLLPPLAVALVLLAWWADPPGPALVLRRGTGLAFAAVLASIAAAAGPPGNLNAPPASADAPFRHRVRGLTGADPDFLLAAADVARRTREGEPVFCGNARHDLTDVNPALIYFVAGRPNATRYDNLHPGVVTAPEVQREIAGDLEGKRVRVVVLWREPGIPRPGDRASAGGATELDAFLNRAFTPVRAFGRYEVRVRAEGQAALRESAAESPLSK